MTNEELIQEARKAQTHAKAQYSNFHVGAALLCEDGEIYHGANIENASYSLTICAERTAAFKAAYDGKTKFKSIAIVSDSKDFTPPCGACRQVLIELCGGELEVVLTNDNNEIKVIKMNELLPLSFNESYL